MITITGSLIAVAIDNHIRAHGGQYSHWYVGIAADAVDRLVNGHNATTAANDAAFWDAGSESVAREIEQHFISMGCRGGDGGGDCRTCKVYIYRISLTTRE